MEFSYRNISAAKNGLGARGRIGIIPNVSPHRPKPKLKPKPVCKCTYKKPGVTRQAGYDEYGKMKRILKWRVNLIDVAT
jgi:hypothetical protein